MNTLGSKLCRKMIARMAVKMGMSLASVTTTFTMAASVTPRETTNT